MRHGELRHVFALTELIARVWPNCHGGGCACRWRGGAGALHTGVHVGLVVITNIEHIVIALEHARQAAKTDVGGAAVTALRHHPHVGASLGFHGGGDAGGNCCGVAKQRVNPRHLPGGFGVWRGKHLQTPGGVGGDQLAVGGGHGGINGVAGAQRLTTTLAGTVTGIE